MTDRTFVMDEAVMVHPVNLHPAFLAAVRAADEAVEDIAFVFAPVRTANRRSDVDMLRERKAERDSFRRAFAGSKADLIDASFDALMGEC